MQGGGLSSEFTNTVFYGTEKTLLLLVTGLSMTQSFKHIAVASSAYKIELSCLPRLH